ncbi:hypothetical protein [Streptomyces sp. NPDC058953]|uniref:hypothetical protein n=1 Tax=unclassified Streptomyces TaxID=2593676 RepID=UPI0036C2B19E
MPTIVLWIAGGVAATGVGALAVDRVLLWAEARRWIYWRRTKTLSSIGVDMLRDTDPTVRAVALSMEREGARRNVRPAEDPPFRLDLDAGTVRIRRPRPADDSG